MQLRIRAAHAADVERLRQIAVAAMGHRGYDPAWVRQWGDAYDSAGLLESHIVFAAQAGEVTVAWASLTPPKHGIAVLDDLWVDPARMGNGLGSRLFSAACEHARALGASSLEWEADPNAVGFYERMGGTHLRDQLGDWGRPLPVMGIDLQSQLA